MSQVFISHVEEDRDIVEEMARGLEAAGYTTWYYERDSLPGLSYLIQTGQALERSQIVLLLISRDSLSSLQVTSEVIQAYESGKSFIPVLRDITHAEFQNRQPEWRRAVGTATSIPLPAGGAAAILPRIIAGLHILGVEPQGEPSPISLPVPAPAPLAFPRPSRQSLAQRKTAAIGLVLLLAVGVALYALWGAIASPPVGEIRRFVGPLGVVGSVAFAPDGRRVLSAGWDSNTSNMLLWDVETGVTVRQFGERTLGVHSVAFAPDGRHIVSGGEDYTLRLWEVESGQELRRFEGHTGSVWSVAWSSDGHRALSGGGGDAAVLLWNLETGKVLHRFAGHTREVYGVAFAPNGRQAVSGGYDYTLRLWRLPR
jgi:TIR domain/WD domain, G-beta repeat